MVSVKIKYSFRFFLLLLIIFSGLNLCAIAQNKKKDKDAPKDQPKSSDYAGKSVAQPKTYQGTGKTLVTKVKDNKNTRKEAEGTGKVLTTKTKPVKTEKQIGDEASMRAAFKGNTSLVDNRARREQNQKSTGTYSGSVSVKEMRNQKHSFNKNNKNMSAYSGTIKVVNTENKRQHSSKKIAEFRGPSPIKVQKSPRGALVATNSKATNTNRNTAIYNRAKLNKGRMMKKEYLANYQKEKQKKLKYDAKEVKMWSEGGGVLANRSNRELPKNNKKANKKAEKRNTTRDPAPEEEPEETEE